MFEILIMLDVGTTCPYWLHFCLLLGCVRRKRRRMCVEVGIVSHELLSYKASSVESFGFIKCMSIALNCLCTISHYVYIYHYVCRYAKIVTITIIHLMNNAVSLTTPLLGQLYRQMLAPNTQAEKLRQRRVNG